MTSARAIGALALTLACAACACGGSSAATAGTGAGGGGAGNGACQTSACVDALSTSVKWEIEIDPSTTGSAAPTELTGVVIGGDLPPLILTADSTGAVNTTFAAAAGGAVPSTANVVLSLQPLIGGRPDVTFEAAALASSDATANATLTVPLGAIASAGSPGRTATLQLIPLSPADQQSPPASFPVMVAGSLDETLPTNTLPISGKLLSALNAPPSATFIARAFLLSGTQVSNAPLTATDGSFNLLLAPEPAGSLVTVELTPLSQSGADPWYTSSALDPAMNRTLAPILLPAYSSTNAFTLMVQDANDPTTVVGDAFVRAQVILGSDPAGTTDFQAGGTTSAPTANGGGTVTLSLLPGTANTALPYNLTVIPTASSSYATRCISPVNVTVGGTASAPSSLVTIGLNRRPVLTGTVTDAAGRPVGNVAITATAGPASTGGCTNTPAVSSSTIADSDGSFSLPLDPGSYQLDYDPPAGAPVPRMTEPAVTVPAGVVQLTHDVALPVAALVRGTVHGPDGALLPSATVRIFRLQCTGQDDCFGLTRTAPELLAQTVSDAAGAFAAVVNANAPSD